MLKNKTAIVVTSVLLWFASTSILSAQTRKPDYMRTFKPRATATPRVWFDPRPSNQPRKVNSPMATQILTVGDPKPSGLNRACQAKIKNINVRSQKLIGDASMVVVKYDAILKRMEDYYMGTLVANGRKLANYAAMKAEINKNKDAVNDTIAILRADINAFNCNDLSGSIKKFNKDAQTLKKAVNNYRLSIEKLGKAIQALGGRPGLPTQKPGVTRAPGATCQPLPKCIKEGCNVNLDPNIDWCRYRPEPQCVEIPVNCLPPNKCQLDRSVNWCPTGPRPTGCVPPPSCIKEGCKIQLDPGTNWCPS